MEHIKIQLKQILDEFNDLKLLKNSNFKLHPNYEYYIDGLQVVIDFEVSKEYYAKIIVKYKDVDIFKISSSNEKHISDCLFKIRTVIDDKIKTLKKQTIFRYVKNYEQQINTTTKRRNYRFKE